MFRFEGVLLEDAPLEDALLWSRSLRSPSFGVAMPRSRPLWSRHFGMESLSLGPRHSTTRCLEAGRLIKPVRAALIGGHGPNDHDMKRRSILGYSLWPGDDRSPWANDDSLLASEPPDNSA